MVSLCVLNNTTKRVARRGIHAGYGNVAVFAPLEFFNAPGPQPLEFCMTASAVLIFFGTAMRLSKSFFTDYFCRENRMLLTMSNNVDNGGRNYHNQISGVGSMQGGGMMGRMMFKSLCAIFLACLIWPWSAMAENTYVGTAACKDCHEEQYENFTKFAKKSHSDRSVKVMASDLTEAELAECYGCHATGYGKPGGFVSYEKTPHLADAGCEVCHGPGSGHVESGGDTTLIKGKLTRTDCEACHNEDRVKSFNFKPLLYGGAH